MARQIFLSHITEEANVAAWLKAQLEAALDGLTVFVSSVDLALGEQWLNRISSELRTSHAAIVLCSGRSLLRPWIHFEAGGAWGRELKVIPVCHAGLTIEELPHPFSQLDGIALVDGSACAWLVSRMGAELGIAVRPGFDGARMWSDLEESLRSSSRSRSRRVAIDLSHGQGRWRKDRPAGIFELYETARGRGDGIQLEACKDERFFRSELRHLSGLILGIPYHRRMRPWVVDGIHDWVQSGGRLLLLGFELGDPHHRSNLGDLARLFGINFNIDIVGDPNSLIKVSVGGQELIDKPYEDPVVFAVPTGSTYALTGELPSIRLRNVQTIGVYPGGTEWLWVGGNVNCVPAPRYVKYDAGYLAQPRGKYCDLRPDSSRLAIAVEAPAGLCGNGCVIAIGTWQIIDDQHPHNATLVTRLLAWLSGDLSTRPS